MVLQLACFHLFVCDVVTDVVTAGEDGTSQFVYYLSADYVAGPATVATLVIVKRPLPLDSTVPLQRQLQLFTFSSGAGRSAQDAVSPYEGLHSMVRYVIAPCFEANTRGESEQTVRRGKGSDDAKTGTSHKHHKEVFGRRH